MLTFHCPKCNYPIGAIKGRDYAICEGCGHRAAVPDGPKAAEVATLTLAELQALRRQNPGAGGGEPPAPPEPPA